VSNPETVSTPLSINRSQLLQPFQRKKKSHREKLQQLIVSVWRRRNLTFFHSLFSFFAPSGALKLRLYRSGYERFQSAPARATEPKLFFTTRLPSPEILSLPPIEIESSRKNLLKFQLYPSL